MYAVARVVITKINLSFRAYVAVAGLILGLSACSSGSEEQAVSTADEQQEAPPTTGAALTDAPATSAPVTSTTSLAGSTSTVPSTEAPEDSTPVNLPAGMPSTWFGVKNDFSVSRTSSVQEFNSSGGSLIRTIDEVEFEEGEPILSAFISVDLSEDLVAVGSCCEPTPAASWVYDRGNGAELGYVLGSEPALGPSDGDLITVDYSAAFNEVVNRAYILNDLETWTSDSFPLISDGGEGVAWSLSGGMIAFETGSGITVGFFDAGELIDVGVELTPPAGFEWTMPAFQSSGNLVVAQDPLDGNGPSRGIVLNREVFAGLAGDVVFAEFVYEGKVFHQGYDASGRFLLYTLEDGSVRWQGAGQRGQLAEPGNFVAAAWH